MMPLRLRAELRDDWSATDFHRGTLPRLPSHLRRTAIHEQFDAGDKTRVVRGQKYRGFGNFIRATHAPHRNAGDDLGDGLLRKRRQDRCIDRAGTNDVSADLAVLEFQGPGADKGTDGSLAGTVDTERGNAFDGGDRACEDNGSAVIEQ